MWHNLLVLQGAEIVAVEQAVVFLTADLQMKRFGFRAHCHVGYYWLSASYQFSDGHYNQVAAAERKSNNPVGPGTFQHTR